MERQKPKSEATNSRPPEPTRGTGFAPFDGPVSGPERRTARSLERELINAGRGRKTTVLLRVARVLFVVAMCTAAGAAWFGYRWLDTLGVFYVNTAQLDLILKQKHFDNSEVFDRDNQKIGEYFTSYQVYVPYEKIPEPLVRAIIAIEDRNFFAHKGFDPKGILRAALSHFSRASSKQGASTLTQQVVRNFLLSNERTLTRKVQEVAYAIQLEKVVSKQKIIEIYANSLFLGNGAYGVGAAARRYFGKDISELTVPEMALVAGLFQSPSRFNPAKTPERAKARQLQVLHAMYQSKYITFAKAKEYMAEPLEYREYQPLNQAVAPYWVDYIKDEAERLLKSKNLRVDNQGLRIYTTIDMKLQRLAENSIKESNPLLDQTASRTQAVRGKNGRMGQATLETALLSVDPRNGEILAMVGGRDYQKTKYNRTYQSMRSPGSAFKPVVYSLALQNKWKWSDMIFVSPITINNYRPHTPDEDMLTETTLMRAFYRSMNTPTIELGQKLGLNHVVEQAKRLGIHSPVKEEFGSMLGSSDATMMDMARMYSTFANNGRQVDLIPITKIKDRTGKIVYEAPPVEARTKAVISPQIAYLMTQGMRAVLAMGTGFASAHLANVAAGKTGTSNESTDNWFCGYAPNLATIVWVGTDEHSQIHGDVTGGKLALPIWDKFMTKAFAEVRPPKSFSAPSGIVWTTVNPKYGNRSPDGVKMFFLRGNEPSAESSALEALSQSTEGGYRDVFAH